MRKNYVYRCLVIGILIVFLTSVVNVQAVEYATNGRMVIEDSFENGDWNGWYYIAESGSVNAALDGSGIKINKPETAGNINVEKRIDKVSGIVSIEYDVKTNESTKVSDTCRE